MRGRLGLRQLLVVLALWGMCESRSVAAFWQENLPDRVKQLPGLGPVSGLELAGQLPVGSCPSRSDCPSLFYWFVASGDEASQDPIVVWINGGPGASSLYGFFAENGPYEVDESGKLTKRAHAWNQRMNYLMIEQASTVGLSYAPEGTRFQSEDEAVSQFYAALTAFFERYPQLAGNALYLAGQSYAGKFLPQVAKKIIDANARAPQDPALKKINLRGIMIGNGWVNPIVQLATVGQYAYGHGLIDQNVLKKVDALYEECAAEIRRQTPSSRKATELCRKMHALIRQTDGVIGANVRKTQPIPDAHITAYLNRPDVRAALHVHPKLGPFHFFSSSFEEDLDLGQHDSVAELYPTLIEAGLSVLIYSGLDDGKDCNFLGTELWLEALTWPGKDQFRAAPTCTWRSRSSDLAGYVRAAKGLTYVKIRHAGHIAPADQPEPVLDMVQKFTSGQKFCD